MKHLEQLRRLSTQEGRPTMTTISLRIIAMLATTVVLIACSNSNNDGGSDKTGSGGSSSNSNGDNAGHAGSANASGGSGGSHASNGAGGSNSTGTGGMSAMDAGNDSGVSNAMTDAATPSYDDVQKWIDDYAKAHPGASGDINTLTPAQIAADPDAQRLLSLCGEDQRPVIPKLAWEHGGGDHAWINPDMSALVYCVYIPVVPSTEHWKYDAAMDHVTADVYVLFPEENACKSESGADQIAKCIGDMTNFEILVDTASLNDGTDVGLSLSEAATELMLVPASASKVHLWTD
jgi:hypothetical protein